MKTVIIITYYWPPNVGVGASRWVEISKGLVAYGWNPIIFTSKNNNFALQGDENQKELQHIPVYKRTIVEPLDSIKSFFGLSKMQQGIPLESAKNSIFNDLLIWMRGNLIIPDPKIRWANRVVDAVCEIISNQKVDLIVSTGPPHSMHILASKASKSTQLPWVMDFRDPWSQWDLLPRLKVGKWALKKHKSLEQSCLKQASAIVGVSPIWCRDLEALAAKPVYLVPNGAYPLTTKYQYEDKQFFSIVFTGLLNESRNAPVLWEVLNQYCLENERFNKHLKLYFYGNISDIVLEDLKSHEKLKDKIILKGYQTKEQTMKAIQKGGVLLNLVNHEPSAYGNLPVKLFEYAMTSRPILNITHPASDAAQMFNDMEGVFNIEKTNNQHLLAQLKMLFQKWRNAELLYTNRKSSFSRDQTTKKMVAVFDDLINHIG